MKKLGIILGLSFLIFSCKDDTPAINTDHQNLKLEKTELSIFENTTDKIVIQEGVAPFKVTSSDETIVKSIIKDKEITISALLKGIANLTVLDSNDSKAVIKVTVEKDFGVIKLQFSKINIKLNKETKIKILNGSGKYSIHSNDQPNNAVKIEKENLIITGITKGTSVIKVKDNKSNKITEISVTVKDSIDLKVNDDNFIDYKGKKEVRIYNGSIHANSINNDTYRTKLVKITSGSGNYDMQLDDNARRLIDVSIEKGNLKIKSKSGNFRDFGTATVIIKDQISGDSKTINVRITLPLDFTKDSFSLRLNKKSKFKTFNRYVVSCKTCLIDHIKITPKDTSIATIEKGNDGHIKGFRVVGNKIGETVVTISDGVREDTQVSVKVIKNILLVKANNRIMAPNDLIKTAVNSTITFKITGSGNFNRTYSPANLIEETNFTKGSGESELTLKAKLIVGTVTVTLKDKVTEQEISFKIGVEQGNVYNCDPNGNFKYKIDYGKATHDDTKIAINGVRVYTCKETITLSVGDVVTFKLCGGSPNNNYDLYDQEGIIGKKREVVKLFSSKVKLDTSSTITALKPGELVIYVRAYDKDLTLKNEYFRILVK